MTFPIEGKRESGKAKRKSETREKRLTKTEVGRTRGTDKLEFTNETSPSWRGEMSEAQNVVFVNCKLAKERRPTSEQRQRQNFQASVLIDENTGISNSHKLLLLFPFLLTITELYNSQKSPTQSRKM